MTRLRTSRWLSGVALTLALMITTTWAQTPEERVRRADGFVEDINDVSDFLEEVDQTLLNARDGHYGSITRQNFDKLILSRNTMVRLLKGQKQATDLDPEQRIEVYNAQETMQAVIRNRPDDRVVCEHIVVHGSRFTKYECLSVYEREWRAKIERENTERFQRLLCADGRPGC